MIKKLQSLKKLLVDRATGSDEQEAVEQYVLLRQCIITDPTYSKAAPNWLVNCRDLNDFLSFIKTEFSTYEERRKFLREELDPLFQIAESRFPSLLEQQITENPQIIEENYIHELTRKAIERKTNDPEGAITLARTLLESVCRKILLDFETPIQENPELPQLYSAVSKALNLAPGSHSEHLFKKILGSCTQVIEGIGAIRNTHGDSHALKQKRARPGPRHATLVVNLAFSMSLFLLDTAKDKKTTSPGYQLLQPNN